MTKTRTQKTITIVSRIIMVLAVLSAVMIGVLKMAERSIEPLKLGLQDYLTQATGHPAEITTLEKTQLFPKIAFVGKGIVIRDKDNHDKALAKADSAYIAMSFWKTFLGIRNYEAFQIENLELATGYALPQKLTLDFAGISDPLTNMTPPLLLLEGTYNKRPLLITAEMQRHGKKDFNYDFKSEFPVTFKLGDSEANAMFKRGGGKIDFAQITLVNKDQEALLSVTDMSFDPLHVSLSGKMAGVPIEGDLSQSGDAYTLSIVPQQTDAKSLAHVTKFIDALRKDLGIDSKTKNMTIDIKTGTTPSDDKEKKNK